MVTGSFAMRVYGDTRFTRDIDVVMQLTDDDVTRFVETFEADYYVSADSVKRAILRRSMFNVINREHGGKLDCIVMKDTDFARTSFSRRYKVTISGIEFWTTTQEDLIIAKLNWARDTHSEMQIRDIANLTSREYDSEYVAGWVQRLDPQNLVRSREMEDTTRESRRLVYDVVMSKSVEERFLMCAELYGDAKELAKVGMPEGLSESEQEAFIFKRLHGVSAAELVTI